jgi:hypothetical protein
LGHDQGNASGSLTKRARVKRSIKTPANGVTAVAGSQHRGESRRAHRLTAVWVICPMATEDAGVGCGLKELVSPSIAAATRPRALVAGSRKG